MNYTYLRMLNPFDVETHLFTDTQHIFNNIKLFESKKANYMNVYFCCS